MDAGADDRRPLRGRPQCRGNELADGGEDDGGVELLRRGAERVACPLGAELEGERLGLGVFRAGEGEDAPALVTRDLAHDVRRGAEAVEADALAVAGELQRPVADEAGAEERRRRATSE